MKFLADMGISQTTVQWLRDKGYDAVHLREQNLQRLTDSEIIDKARKEGQIILTCDLDFASLIAASKGQLPSVIIFRLNNERPENINKQLFSVLKKGSDSLQQGAIISVEENRFRIRLLPIL